MIPSYMPLTVAKVDAPRPMGKRNFQATMTPNSGSRTRLAVISPVLSRVDKNTTKIVIAAVVGINWANMRRLGKMTPPAAYPAFL